ncbi:phosphoribosylanthranilate isomerase [Paracoccaceae bacterium]|nr:phosphoribosylanthranilate isomerase [Paracoccaceae bacterium]
MSSVNVKICGLTTGSSVTTAVTAGADYLGFVFFSKSPRYLTFSQAADFATLIPKNVIQVALVVDPNNDLLTNMMKYVPIDMIQLQGTETPQRVREVKELTRLPVMKAIGVSEPEDLDIIDSYATVADQLLIDAKPPKGSILPGGNGLAFDWGLMTGKTWDVPWMLAGGLNPENVTEAIKTTGTAQIDVSSGVERAPGDKDPDKVTRFIQNAKRSHQTT